jgi:hypothetical protein
MFMSSKDSNARFVVEIKMVCVSSIKLEGETVLVATVAWQNRSFERRPASRNKTASALLIPPTTQN